MHLCTCKSKDSIHSLALYNYTHLSTHIHTHTHIHTQNTLSRRTSMLCGPVLKVHTHTHTHTQREREREDGTFKYATTHIRMYVDISRSIHIWMHAHIRDRKMSVSHDKEFTLDPPSWSYLPDKALPNKPFLSSSSSHLHLSLSLSLSLFLSLSLSLCPSVPLSLARSVSIASVFPCPSTCLLVQPQHRPVA